MEARKDAINIESKLDARKPDVFTGKDKKAWIPWVDSLHKYFELKPTMFDTDQAKVNFAVVYLTEAANSHYANLKARDQYSPVPALHNWMEFLKEFQKYFGIYDIKGFAQAEIARIVQLKNESFADFFSCFQEWAVKTGFNDEALLHQLRKSVHQWMDITISAQRPRPTTYDEWVESYSMLDAGVRERNLIQGTSGGETGMLPFASNWQATAPAPIQYQNPSNGSIQAVQWFTPRGNWTNRNQGNVNNSNSRTRGAAALELEAPDQATEVPEGIFVGENDQFWSMVESGNECSCSDSGDFSGNTLMRAAGFWNDDVCKLMNEQHQKNLCLNCGGSGHYRAECKNPEDLAGLDMEAKDMDNRNDKKPWQNKPKLRTVFSVNDKDKLEVTWDINVVDDEGVQGNM